MGFGDTFGWVPPVFLLALLCVVYGTLDYQQRTLQNVAFAKAGIACRQQKAIFLTAESVSDGRILATCGRPHAEVIKVWVESK